MIDTDNKIILKLKWFWQDTNMPLHVDWDEKTLPWNKVGNMKQGTRVRMSDAYKKAITANDCIAHVEEFGECVGIVEGLVDYNTYKGPEVNVRWLPSKLRYGYHPDDLIVVD